MIKMKKSAINLNLHFSIFCLSKDVHTSTSQGLEISKEIIDPVIRP
jgi:hypothetical protein